MKMFRLFVAVVLLAACGSDSTGPGNASASIAGSYTLRSINGSALPFSIQAGGNTVSIVGMNFVVADGGTWTNSVTVRQVVGGGSAQNQILSEGGTWARAGTAVGFIDGSNGLTEYTGTFSGSSLSISDGTLAYVFTK